MMHFSFNIQVNLFEDTETIINVLKNRGISTPIFVTDYNGSYSIKFDSDYEYYEVYTDLEKSFPQYERAECINLGASNIQIIVTKIQEPHSTDCWGRHLNTDSITTTTYFMKKEYSNHSYSTNNINGTIRILLEENEEKKVKLNIVNGIYRNTDKKGFLVKKATEEQESKVLVNTLFESREDAFWGGYYAIKSIIENQYKEYKSFIKSKRKHKPSFDEWLAEITIKNEKLIKQKASLKPRDKIHHPKFGVGTIIDLDSHKCIVDFTGEIKTLILEYALISKVED